MRDAGTEIRKTEESSEMVSFKMPSHGIFEELNVSIFDDQTACAVLFRPFVCLFKGMYEVLLR